MSFIVARMLRRWLEEEAGRTGATSSDIVRSAIGLYRSQPPQIRRAALQPGTSSDGEADSVMAAGQREPVATARDPPSR